MTILNLVIAAINDQTSRPHQGKFDPRAVWSSFNMTSVRVSNARTIAGSPTQESAGILFTRGDLVEFVDSGIQRHAFHLDPTGVYTLGGVFKSALSGPYPIDPRRLETALLDIRDETRQSAALNALAAALFSKN